MSTAMQLRGSCPLHLCSGPLALLTSEPVAQACCLGRMRHCPEAALAVQPLEGVVVSLLSPPLFNLLHLGRGRKALGVSTPWPEVLASSPTRDGASTHLPSVKLLIPLIDDGLPAG